jgi:hypothetical protein
MDDHFYASFVLGHTDCGHFHYFIIAPWTIEVLDICSLALVCIISLARCEDISSLLANSLCNESFLMVDHELPCPYRG